MLSSCCVPFAYSLYSFRRWHRSPLCRIELALFPRKTNSRGRHVNDSTNFQVVVAFNWNYPAVFFPINLTTMHQLCCYELLTGKDVGGSGRGLFWGHIQWCAWRDSENSFNLADHRDQIATRVLPSTKRRADDYIEMNHSNVGDAVPRKTRERSVLSRSSAVQLFMCSHSFKILMLQSTDRAV
jgi:hypothetical protein